MPFVSDKQLRCLEFCNREHGIRHHTYDEEMYQFELLKNGDERAIEESTKIWDTDLPGHIVKDPVLNMRYLCIASVTLATRFAILGGLDEETAYNTSDLYIQKLDQAASVAEMRTIHKDMFAFFTHKVAGAKKKTVFSKPIVQCLDYIYYHLHEKITVAALAEHVDLNASYLSTLFTNEMGLSISEYILEKKIETAQNMLRFSDLSVADIAATLAFSSQSHFTKVFKEKTGVTPKLYKDKYFQIGFLNTNSKNNSTA